MSNMIFRYTFINQKSSLIEAQWRIHASVNQAFIGSNNGLPPIRWTNDGLL